jgi:lipid A 4'-phosphatase
MLVSYLKLRRCWLIVGGFALASALFVTFPGIDIRVAGLFFDHGFQQQDLWWNRLLHGSLAYFLWISVGCVLAVYAVNRLTRRNLLNIRGRTVAYLLLVLVIGAGVIVNYTFKDHFGRARPRDVEVFGGPLRFTPAFVISDQCHRNCSFSSGDAAGAFFAVALARALSRRRLVLGIAVGFAALVAYSRIAAGAHFLSDTLVSTFVMLLTTDVLYHYLLSPASVPDS